MGLFEGKKRVRLVINSRRTWSIGPGIDETQSLRSIIVSMVLDPHPELWEGDERLGEAPINKRKITIDWGNEVDILFVTDTGYLQKKLKVNQLDRIDKMVE